MDRRGISAQAHWYSGLEGIATEWIAHHENHLLVPSRKAGNINLDVEVCRGERFSYQHIEIFDFSVKHAKLRKVGVSDRSGGKECTYSRQRRNLASKRRPGCMSLMYPLIGKI